MNRDEDKFKHSARLHKEEVAIKKQQKIAIQKGMDRKQVEREPHRFAKHHAMDCGKPNCTMCANPRKIFEEKTMQEKSFEQTEGWDD
jgi:hypothetical protein